MLFHLKLCGSLRYQNRIRMRFYISPTKRTVFKFLTVWLNRGLRHPSQPIIEMVVAPQKIVLSMGPVRRSSFELPLRSFPGRARSKSLLIQVGQRPAF